MHDWNSPTELQRDIDITTKLVNIWMGLYLWEMVTSMGFERAVIKKMRVLQWQTAPYFISRYSYMIALLCYGTVMNSMSRANCSTLHAVFFFFETSIVFASTCFALRTMAIWNNRFVTRGLWTIVAGHAVLVVISTLQSRAVWNESLAACVYLDPSRAYLIVAIARVYTVVLDALILTLNVYKLRVGFMASRDKGQRGLVWVLLEQGLIYFIIAFLCNVTAVGFLIWKPNFLIGIIATTPASMFTVIVACRSVRNLSDFVAQECQGAYRLPTIATGPMEFTNSIASEGEVRNLTKIIHEK
ncbi:hypothetical protein CPB83DRAFT_207783 [Crepidotus variabilis]|uniref:Uncharacterized protein n=1 Tax=Crepidotus variabilis TaxID=179855 RepID=A0A9P6JW34_9AGAR|nr:hypothetical protein CPB83DRAFT_207783 [Crepidotus variabilis]